MGERWKRQSSMAFLLMRRATIYRPGLLGVSGQNLKIWCHWPPALLRYLNDISFGECCKTGVINFGDSGGGLLLGFGGSAKNYSGCWRVLPKGDILLNMGFILATPLPLLPH